MIRKLTLLAALVLLSAQSWAIFEPVRKYELKSDMYIYEGYEKDGSVYLYNYKSAASTKFDRNEVVASTSDSIDGIKESGTVLLHTTLSPQAECTVESVFENKDIYVFCDEIGKVNGAPQVQVPIRSHYLAPSSHYEKDLDTLGEFSKDQVLVLSKATSKFDAGDKVRIIHLYASSTAIIEYSYRKIARGSIPKYEEVVSFSQLK